MRTIESLGKIWQRIDESVSPAIQDEKRYALVHRLIKNEIGAKAGNLARLKHFGFQVPNGFILNADFFRSCLEEEGLWPKVKEQLDVLYFTNIGLVSNRIQNILNQFTGDCIRSALGEFVDPQKTYAVRSSASLEDLAEKSFAGQYHSSLHCQGVDAVIQAVKECYRSLYGQVNLHYLLDHHLSPHDLSMSVLVQEMIDADVSGVVFTVNPVRGTDTECMLEVTRGTADRLVSGQINGQRYRYDWYADEWTELPSERPFLNPYLREVLVEEALKVQEHFGRPQDIEFCFYLNQLYIIQSRPITSLQFAAYDQMWSTADFKDGGVSSTVCTPYMWSLYEYIWERKLRQFLLETKVLKESEVPPALSRMIFSRPYWNLSAVKYAMSKIPGYVERDFDEEYGVEKTYAGDGQKTKINPASLVHVGKIGFALKRLRKEQAKRLENFREEKRARYRELLDLLEADKKEAIDGKIVVIWYHLTRFEYMDVEGTYFWQIFMNTVEQAIQKEKITKQISKKEYMSLLGSLDNISHLRPFHEMWDLSRQIRNDESLLEKWEEDATTIREKYWQNSSDYPYLESYLAEYGYHSDRELQVHLSNYAEDPLSVIKYIQQFIALDDGQDPRRVQDEQRQQAKKVRENILLTLGEKVGQEILSMVDRLRTMLWWREELRDLSTMYYHLIRMYTMRVAEILVKEGKIPVVGDIWFYKIEELWTYFDGKEEIDFMGLLRKHTRYYLSFRNYKNPNEIGKLFEKQYSPKLPSEQNLFRGIACNQGVVRAKARVIETLEDIEEIEAGEILVTKFTDTGWTPKFAILAAVVTEYGGLLCHAAIVSREYGLPCIVHAEDIVSKIPNGALIEVDGGQGTIRIIKEMV